MIRPWSRQMIASELRTVDRRCAMTNVVRPGALSQKLYDELTGIQWGTKPDPFGWVCPID